mmetsp:Transcript_10463/g.17556  ORF Transcript_10463/g.17556 Transcript_10463/m.17556 type:complete len:81 (+) Transcript_10463:548-790(+)
MQRQGDLSGLKFHSGNDSSLPNIDIKRGTGSLAKRNFSSEKNTSNLQSQVHEEESQRSYDTKRSEEEAAERGFGTGGRKN